MGFEKVDLSTSVNIGQMVSRRIQEAFKYGIDCSIISGGLLAGGIEQSIYAQSITQNYYLGSKLRMIDGREFIYQKDAAGAAIATMRQAEAPMTNWADEVQTAYGWAADQSKGTILITTGSVLTADEWKDGFLTVVSTGTVLGQCYKIKSNTAHETLPWVTLYDSVVSAISATALVTIVKNRFLDTIVVPTGALTARETGVPLIAITAGYYFWGQVKGPAPLLVDTGGALVIGDPVGNGAAVAGACDIAVTTKGHWGRVLAVQAAAEYALIDLDLGL